MDKELQDFLLRTLQDGKDFTISQAPDVVQQYLSWCFWSNAFGAIFWTIVFVAVIIGTVKTMGNFSKKDTEIRILISFLGGVIACLPAKFCGVCFYCALYIYVAPKAYLLDCFLSLHK